jgi:hypothetical protein
VANTRPPEKESGAEAWLSLDAFNAYICGKDFRDAAHFIRDHAIADREANLGIAIDPDTQTTGHGAAEGKIYTAHYLHLRDDWRLAAQLDLPPDRRGSSARCE